VGLILIVAGLVRTGFLADYLARPVATGFLSGLALLVIIGAPAQEVSRGPPLSFCWA
jgi:MFS superfamily sulfate permease-like transporter